MSDEYTGQTSSGDFQGSLVDNSLKKEHLNTDYSENGPSVGDTTDEGGYGGDPFSRENQAPQQKGQFSQDRSADRSAPYQQQDSTKEEDDQDRYAGEGIIPPNETTSAQAASSGVGAQSQFNQQSTPQDGSNIGA